MMFIMFFVVCLIKLSQCGGENYHHKKILIHIPVHEKHHKHVHTVVKHIHHHHKPIVIKEEKVIKKEIHKPIHIKEEVNHEHFHHHYKHDHPHVEIEEAGGYEHQEGGIIDGGDFHGSNGGHQGLP